MNKNILIGLLITGLFLSSAQINKTYAQFDIENLSLGAHIGYAGWLGLGSNVAFGLCGHYVQSDKYAVNVSYNTQIPVTPDAYSVYANAFSSSTNPSSVEVKITDKIAFHNISFDAHYYFLGDLEKSFGMYGLGGLGTTFANLSSEVSNYDKSNYSLGIDEKFPYYTGIIINAGLGANFALSDQMAIFGEGKIGIPTNRPINQAIFNPIPFNYGLVVGVRFNPFK